MEQNAYCEIKRAVWNGNNHVSQRYMQKVVTP